MVHTVSGEALTPTGMLCLVKSSSHAAGSLQVQLVQLPVKPLT